MGVKRKQNEMPVETGGTNSVSPTTAKRTCNISLQNDAESPSPSSEQKHTLGTISLPAHDQQGKKIRKVPNTKRLVFIDKWIEGSDSSSLVSRWIHTEMRINRLDPLEATFQQFCDEQGLDRSKYYFTHCGSPILGSESLHSRRIKARHYIYATPVENSTVY